jgi:hypothetical protein
VIGNLEQPGECGIATVSRVLDDEVAAGTAGCGEQHGGSAGDLVGAVQLPAVPLGHVVDPEDVVACADDRWTVIVVSSEEARD